MKNWSSCIGFVWYPGGAHEELTCVDRACVLVKQGRTDLQFLHYQLEGFEHYNCITCDHADPNTAVSKAKTIIEFVSASEVAMSLVAGDYNAVRRKILAILGRELPEDLSDALLSSSGESSDSDESGVASASEYPASGQP